MPRLPLACAFAAACVAVPSHAGLGGAVDTVQADAAHLNATVRVNSHAGYTVHQLTLASGTVVREYAAPSGSVFAVAWQGPFKPDLSQLLGASYARLVQAANVQRADHRALVVHDADLIVESHGRMRAFSGRAYLPTQLPAGFSAGDIR